MAFYCNIISLKVNINGIETAGCQVEMSDEFVEGRDLLLGQL